MWRRSAISLAAGLAYVFWPRNGDLRGFNPRAVARLETAMWQHGYQRNYSKWFRALYSLNREVYDLSPWASLRLSYYAARAARSFQSARRRKAAKRALPLLERYYALLRLHSSKRFDPAKIAQLELHWWQLRRENSSPSQYGEVMARVQEELYGVRDDQMKRAALLRAEMMGYRDERHTGKMQSQDWAYIDDGLLRSYQLLKTAGANAASRRSWN